MSMDDIGAVGGTVLTGYQSDWPPKPAEVDRGIMFAGFPARAVELPAEHQISWGIYSALGVASSVNRSDVSCLIERHEWIPTPELKQPEVGYDLGGMSGAPMLTLVHGALVGWRLAGVIYECSSEFEIVKAVRADFIEADGTVTG